MLMAVLSLDQIKSLLVYFAICYPVITFYFYDSTAGKKKKRTSLMYSFIILGIVSSLKVVHDFKSLPINHYSTLGVSRHSNTLDIRRSYKQLSKAYHPDKHLNNLNGEDASAKFRHIQDAYEVLMDETNRDLFNRFGRLDSYTVDPRKYELELLSGLILTYLFYVVVVHIMTLPNSSRAGRTWTAIGGISLLVVETTFLITESTVPADWTFLPQTLTEREVIFALHSLFPVLVVGLKVVSEFWYVDVDRTTVSVLHSLVRHQQVS